MEYFETLSSARCRMPDALEGRGDATLRRRLTGRGEDLQILAAGQVAVEAGFVDDRPDPGQGQVTVARNGMAEQEHCAGIGVGQTQQHSDQRGLAGTIRTEVAEGATTGNEELNIVDGDVVPESFGQSVRLDSPLAVSRSSVQCVRKESCTHTIIRRGASGPTRANLIALALLPIASTRRAHC